MLSGSITTIGSFISFASLIAPRKASRAGTSPLSSPPGNLACTAATGTVPRPTCPSVVCFNSRFIASGCSSSTCSKRLRAIVHLAAGIRVPKLAEFGANWRRLPPVRAALAHYSAEFQGLQRSLGHRVGNREGLLCHRRREIRFRLAARRRSTFPIPLVNEPPVFNRHSRFG